jgi:hypothetical protein
MSVFYYISTILQDKCPIKWHLPYNSRAFMWIKWKSSTGPTSSSNTINQSKGAFMEEQSEFWNSGYITDLDYTHGFYRELEPGYLSCAALFSGHLPPDTDSTFSYCELGCGNGLSTNIIASAWPRPWLKRATGLRS